MKKLWQILLMIIGGVPGTWYETFVPGTLIYLPLGGGSNGEPNGFSSFTQTWNWHVLLFPAASVAMQLTVVQPGGNTLPEGGLHATVGGPQSSVAVGAGYATGAPTVLVATTVTSGGQVMTGGFVSTTVKVAALLVAEPPPLVTITSYFEPLSASATPVRMRVEEVAPEIAAPSFRHW